MMTTVKGTYKDGKVELTETPTGVGEQAPVLVTFLPDEHAVRTAQPLYGVWRGKFPADFDLNAALKEIRGEWAKGWEEDACA